MGFWRWFNINIPTLTYNYTAPGTYNVKLYSMNTFGCTDSANTTVSVLPVPQVSYTYTKYDSCILPSNYGFTNTSSGATSYLWSFGQLANSIQTNPLSLLLMMEYMMLS